MYLNQRSQKKGGFNEVYVFRYCVSFFFAFSAQVAVADNFVQEDKFIHELPENRMYVNPDDLLITNEGSF